MQYNDPWMQVGGSFLLSFGLAWFIIPAIITLVRQKNLFAEPNSRSSHVFKTPTLGGVGVFLSIMVAIPLWAHSGNWDFFRHLFAAMVVIFTIGVKDDILIISPLKKMAGQVLAAAILVVLADVRISHFHGFFNIFYVPWLVSVGFSLLVFVVLINAINFIDGIDGLAAGVGVLSSLTFGTWFWLDQKLGLAVVAYSLAGALAAFLYYNVFSKQFKIFMGDTGSLLIGLIISVLAIEFNELNICKTSSLSVHSTPSVTFAILVLPLFDFFRIIFVRRVLRRPLSSPDRLHIHHRVLRLGLSHRAATFWMLGINAGFALFGFVFQFISIRRLLLIELLLAMVLAYLPVYLYDRRRAKAAANTQK